MITIREFIKDHGLGNPYDVRLQQRVARHLRDVGYVSVSRKMNDRYSRGWIKMIELSAGDDEAIKRAIKSVTECN